MSTTIAMLGGEGIGPEVIDATAAVLRRLVPDVTLTWPAHGEAAAKAYGTPIPDATKEACRAADAVLFGAVERHCKEVLRFLRWGLLAYANLRPVRTRRGVSARLPTRSPIDLLIVRENLEGEYPTREGSLAELTTRWPEFTDVLGQRLPTTGSFALRITTEEGCRRISEVAARLAGERRQRGLPGKVTIVTKENVLRATDGMFRAVAERILEHANVEHEHLFVDDACRRLAVEPERFDVILAPNLYGDVLSDLAAELAGGLGLMPSGCIGDEHCYFESVHGSAPDIAGKGVANPLATMLSAVMLLEHLGRHCDARRLDDAIGRTLAEGRARTPDLGGTARTEDIVSEVLGYLDKET